MALHIIIVTLVPSSVVNKDLSFKAKAKDLTFKVKAKDLTFKAKTKDSKFVLKDISRPRTTTLVPSVLWCCFWGTGSKKPAAMVCILKRFFSWTWPNVDN